jgi:virginiamycin B lyase
MQRYRSALIHRATLTWLALVVLLLSACGSTTQTRTQATATPTPTAGLTITPSATAGMQSSLTLTTFPLGIQGSVSSMTSGPDGALWFTSFTQSPPNSDIGASTVGRMTMAGAVTTFPLPSASSAPASITAGPDGNLWFVEPASNAIGRITTSGAVTEYALPTIRGQTSTALFSIVAGSDGNLWFSWLRVVPSLDQASIGRITPAGTITAFPLTLPYDSVGGITSGPDGNLWFTVGEACTEPCHQPAIGRITTSGVVTNFAFSDGLTSPYHITLGVDGNLWFAGAYGNVALSMVGRITPLGVSKVFQLPCSGPGNCLEADSITSGPDGALWFAGGQGTIGRSTTTGVITEYHASLPGPIGPLTIGPDGKLWVASGAAVGRVTL